jgi:RNA polymerase sigma-70 factor (ECF subfamily)
VRRVLAGETALFEIIMRRYNQRIYRAVRAILRADDDAEDVMQQAYVSAYQHLHQWAERAQFSTWLTRIAVNEALARLKKRNRTFTIVEEKDVMAEIESKAPSPEQDAVTSQLRHVMEQQVAALPDTYRTVLVLRDIEGLTTAETAECLGINEDAVKTRLHRAHAMMRENLYERAGVTLQTLFEFGDARCDRVVAAVLSRIAS